MRSFIRNFLAAMAVLTLALAVQAAHAGGPKAQTQVPGAYRAQVGDFEITALLDGTIPLDTGLLKNARPGEIDPLLARMFVGNPKMLTAVTAYLVNTGAELVLVDTGMGAHRGPALGHLPANLRAAGVDPAQIDAVILTHMHGDHIGGLSDASGKALFPKARVLVDAREAAYWTSVEEEAKAAEGRKPFFRMARKMAAPYQAEGRWKTFQPGDALLPGITAIEAVGHTPGHTVFAVESRGQKLMIWGDLVHAHAVQFARPGVSIEFDSDQAQAIATRRLLMQDAASRGYLVGGMHLPFPGLGHVRQDGPETYAWVPVEFAPLPAPAAK